MKEYCVITHRKPQLVARIRRRGATYDDWMYLGLKFNTPKHFEDWMQQGDRDLINFEYEVVWI